MNGQIGKVRSAMWGYPLELWESVFFWATGIAAVAGAIAVASVFVAGIIGYKITDVVTHESEIRIGEAEARISEATARAEEAKAGAAAATENAANANERAASLERDATRARLETERLKAQLAWRVLPQNIANAIGNNLSASVGKINIQYAANDTEALYFAIQLANIFGKAGWQVGMLSVTLSGTVVFGLWVPDTQSPFTQTIRTALEGAGIGFSRQALPTSNTVMSSGNQIPGAPILFVGSKPMPQ